MNNEQKIANMSALIKSLSEENENLKEEIAALRFTLDLSEKKYDGSLSKAKELIAQCTPLTKEYEEAIAGAYEAKQQYQAATREIYALKQQYKKEMEKLIKKM